MKASIIVDVQNYFLLGGSLAVKEADKIMPVINQLQDQYDLVVTTQDEHPPNYKSFASQHAGKNIYEIIHLHRLQQVL